MKYYMLILLAFFLCSMGVKEANDKWPKTVLIDQKNKDTLKSGDTLLIDFKQGIISPLPVYWGVTTFREIKKMYGKTKRRNSNRYIFSPDYGFFPVVSSLVYPELGIEFTFHVGNNVKGQRSFFQNHKINQVIIRKNCRIKSIEGIRFGSTFSEITSELKINNVKYLRDGTKKTAEFSVVYYLANSLKLSVSFIGQDAEMGGFILNEFIRINIFQ